MRRYEAAKLAGVPVTVQGDVGGAAAAETAAKIRALGRYTSAPILHARVRVTRSADPAVARPVVAQANLDVNGTTVRAQVAAATTGEAVDLLRDRLRQRLRRLVRRGQARRRSVRPPGRLTRRRVRTARPGYTFRPPPQRQVVVRKAYAPALVSPDEAAFDMELLDYDFYLFTDAETGQDSVIYRAPPSGYRMASLVPPPATWPAPVVPLTVSQQPAARLDLASARQRLDLSGRPFLFYADAGTGRGHVLYRRFDGHYGLITPADQIQG